MPPDHDARRPPRAAPAGPPRECFFFRPPRPAPYLRRVPPRPAPARPGMPIIPVGFGYDRPWRLRSWDRFAIPRPWTLGTCVTAPAVVVPPDAGKEELEHHRQTVEAALSAVSDIAEQWAETGRWP